MRPDWTNTGSEIQGARARMAALVRTTPLLASSTAPGLYHKLESLQITGSFKLRAALNQLLSLSQQERSRGIVTSSSGNFAQAVAFAALQMEVSAKVVMMPGASPLKVARTRHWKAEVVFCEDRFESRQETVEAIAAQEGRTIVHPYDHPAAIFGNGTAGLEILEQLPGVAHVVAPVSGGGLIAGLALALRQSNRNVQIWGVQPRGSNATALSWEKGAPVSLERARTVADGLTVTTPGRLTFPLIQELVSGLVTVREESILQAARLYLAEERLVVEPSGAVPLAAVLESLVPVEQTVLLVSGGNVAPEILLELLSGPS